MNALTCSGVSRGTGRMAYAHTLYRCCGADDRRVPQCLAPWVSSQDALRVFMTWYLAAPRASGPGEEGGRHEVTHNISAVFF